MEATEYRKDLSTQAQESRSQTERLPGSVGDTDSSRSAGFCGRGLTPGVTGVSYHIDFGPKNDDIGAENGYFWNTNVDISIC